MPSGLHSKPGTILLCPHSRTCWGLHAKALSTVEIPKQPKCPAQQQKRQHSPQATHKPLLSPLQLRQSVHWLVFGNQPSQGHAGNQPHRMGTAYSAWVGLNLAKGFRSCFPRHWHVAHIGCGGQSFPYCELLSQIRECGKREGETLLRAADFQEDEQPTGLQIHPDTHPHISMSIYICHTKPSPTQSLN